MFRMVKSSQGFCQKLCCVVLLILLMLSTNRSVVWAERGQPGSSEFGIGAIIYPEGPYISEALAMGASLNLDWISVPVSWKAYQPVKGNAPRLAGLAPVLEFALQNRVSTLVSLSDAPDWAETISGPDPVATARFVQAILQEYPAAVQAIELFPGANTRSGWGSQVDPQAYSRLFTYIQEQLAGSGSQVLLVAAGLRPLGPTPPAGDMDDLKFLQGLYQNGAGEWMPVISLSFTQLTGDPLLFPTSREHRVFRHYEEVRNLMLANHHKNGVIWITRLSLPSGTISSSDDAYHNLDAQSTWLSQAYVQTRSQLYVGVTIGQSLNPEPEDAASEVPSLIRSNESIHPFYSILREMTSLNKMGGVPTRPGKPKEGNFIKKRP